jgi:4-aminobutyrate aminotransferase-like enzyme/Ser/Thr protein kinase RdoA (MazF antagonist)
MIRPSYIAADAARLAADLYGLRATARELPSERDRNFLLECGDGRKLVLKIANREEQYGLLEFQSQVLERLARVAPVPFPCGVVKKHDGHLVRLLSWLPGRPLAEIRPHSRELLARIGRHLAAMDRALANFDHAAAHRDFPWDLRRAVPDLDHLRTGIIHGDANDYNILVERQQVTGIIDFGDMIWSVLAAEPAVAAAYVMLGKRDPLAAAASLVGGYHAVLPLEPEEIEALYPLILARLNLSVSVARRQMAREPDNEYLAISQKGVRELLKRLAPIDPHFAHAVFRHACGLEPCPRNTLVVNWLRHCDPGPLLPVQGPSLVFDLSVAHASTCAPTTRDWSDSLFAEIRAAGAVFGVGRYNEARMVYTGRQYALESDEFPERRTIHIGLDLFAAPGTPVLAPLDGQVHSFGNNKAWRDYGPTIILRHDRDGLECFTLYGHLSARSLKSLRQGKRIRRGQRLGWIGDTHENGDWPPHLHFQIITHMLGQEGDFPGVAPPSRRAVWLSLSPDPSLIARFDLPQPRARDLLAERRERLGRNLSLSYKRPLHIVRGQGQYLYDAEGRQYLDGVNNVAHVGHSHPRVVEAVARQMAILNTNTRYLHENILRYAARLTAKLPKPLRVCYFVNSGSEANELALRLARAHTRRRDIIVLDAAYHGNTTTLIDISPYKHNGPGGEGTPPWVRVARSWTDPAAVAELARACPPAAFICEPILSCAGQIVLPRGYLREAYRAVREAGGVCIADEVQTGFGRVGTHFWGFETQGVTPDIVTLGKPIGNGHPLGAVITTPEIADSFETGMEYFNTFGGNPVSCAAGLAVLEVIKEEGLQRRARDVGARLKQGLAALRFPDLIRDVRGFGLFLGVELPDAARATYVVERLKDHGVLLSTDGPEHNVIKIKPPMVFSAEDADYLVSIFDRVLDENDGGA